jgi:hypothetical protein
MVAKSGSIGTRRDLEVRLGDTLRPQLFVLSLASGDPLDPTGSQIYARIFRRENDLTPLVSPTFTVEVIPPLVTGEARFLLRLEKEKIDALAALPPLVGGPTPQLRAIDAGRRVLYWAVSFQDAEGTRFPLYYGKLTIYLGAAPAGAVGA